MLSQKMEAALNGQIGMEAAASQKYLAMAIWADTKGLEGTAAFFFEHADEERMHMMKLVNYILDSGGTPIIPALEAPKNSYKDVLATIEAAYESEQKVTRSIHELVTLALAEHDHDSNNFLQWYVSEQREEEVLMRKIIDRIKLIGDGPQALYYIDKAILQAGIEAEAAENEE